MIHRDVAGAAAEQFDLIVVGGGIHGASLAMEASRRGLRPLLLERDDFGGATSWNSLRIVHGGLRYLQSLDLSRFRQSVSERTWFCATYPDLVEPLECLMPLYGEGLRRPSAFRAALFLNDLLTRKRNVGVRSDRHLSAGRVLGPADTVARFPLVEPEGLKGGGVWYDAVMRSSVRVLVETLRWACHNGAVTLNYVECVGLLGEGRVTGVEAVERLSGDVVQFHAPVVVLCAGPWSRDLARRFDREREALFRPSLAFNLLVNREPPSTAALAVAPRRAGGRTYFLRPWRSRTLAGTFHAPCDSYPADPTPSGEQLDRFLADLNASVPALELSAHDVVRVYAGLLPARRQGTEDLAVREIVLDHAQAGSRSGLWSVSGVKYTTARAVAELTLRRVFARGGRDLRVRPGSERPPSRAGLSWDDPRTLSTADEASVGTALKALVEEEAVIYMDDLLFRRTDWGTDPQRGAAVAASVAKLLGRQLPSPTLLSTATATSDQ